MRSNLDRVSYHSDSGSAIELLEWLSAKVSEGYNHYDLHVGPNYWPQIRLDLTKNLSDKEKVSNEIDYLEQRISDLKLRLDGKG